MTNKNITDLNDQSFAQTIRADGTVLVDFWAEWCQPCLVLAPTLEAIANDHADDNSVAVAKVNIDDNQQLAAEFGITSIPTVLVFEGGEVRERIVGINAKDVYTDAIKANQAHS